MTRTYICPRCGVAFEAKAQGTVNRCEDCQSLGWHERPAVIKKQLAKQLTSRCDCGRSTWADCATCQQLVTHFNNQRIRRRRAVA